MQYIDLKDCSIESTNILCPSCQNTLLQKLIPASGSKFPTIYDSTHPWLYNYGYFFVCPNNECRFLGSPGVIQVDSIYEQLSTLNIKFVDFTCSFVAGFNPLTIVFNAITIGLNPSKYTWDFGDGAVKTTTNSEISHEYALPGTYSVTLTVTDNILKVSEVSYKYNLITVSTYLPPTCNFTMSPLYGNNKLEVNFKDLSTGSEIVKWKWKFGDGIESNEQNPTHFYEAPGKYTVELTITNSKQQTSLLVKPNVIDVRLTAPVAKFIQDAVAGYVPLTVEFTYSGANDNIVDNFLWDFGDGNTSTEENPIHKYTVAGLYNVSLTVSNSMGSDSIMSSTPIIVKSTT